MSASTIIDKNCDDIQAAMAVALLQFSRVHGISYGEMGRAMEREKQSVAQYINNGAEMPATCWLKAAAKWPELTERLHYNLDDSEKAFRARQRELRLEQPEEKRVAA